VALSCLSAALLGQYKKAYDKLRTEKPPLTPELALQQDPRWLAAWQRADEATKDYVRASNALGEYQAQKAKLRWYETMKDAEGRSFEGLSRQSARCVTPGLRSRKSSRTRASRSAKAHLLRAQHGGRSPRREADALAE
jgi:hypothetical protein